MKLTPAPASSPVSPCLAAETALASSANTGARGSSPALRLVQSRLNGLLDRNLQEGLRWVCPVTDLPAVAGGTTFVALRPCGHVLAQRAAAQVGGAACPVCGLPATTTVQMNPPTDVVRFSLRRLQFRDGENR